MWLFLVLMNISVFYFFRCPKYCIILPCLPEWAHDAASRASGHPCVNLDGGSACFVLMSSHRLPLRWVRVSFFSVLTEIEIICPSNVCEIFALNRMRVLCKNLHRQHKMSMTVMYHVTMIMYPMRFYYQI